MKRRDVLKALALSPLLLRGRAFAQSVEPKLLIVIGATGGASIIDSFLAVRESECAAGATLNTFPDASVSTIGQFRAVSYSASKLGAIPIPVNGDQNAFVTKHHGDMLVATCVGTSVNHALAQKRSLTGNNAWGGRTLQECVALQHGNGMLLPNVNMAAQGFAERGTDRSLPAWCFAETVANPSLWRLGLDAREGQTGSPTAEALAQARAVRDKLDAESMFSRTFVKSARLDRWRTQRARAPAIEAGGLYAKLDPTQLLDVFPNQAADSFEAQAAMAFLLLKHGVSATVTLSPSFNAITQNTTVVSPPLAFDFSHNDHRGAQAFMWNRILSVTDRLIDLLKGQDLWRRSLIYIATDFGRTRARPSGETVFNTGHDLNNGFLMLSPLLNGGKVLGGVNPQTTLAHGFDPESGAPVLDKYDTNEKDIFAGILHALGVDTAGSGLPDARAFRRV